MDKKEKISKNKKLSPTTKKKRKKQSHTQSDSKKLNSLYWVGIGASAGGLEALREFVSKIPGSATRNNNITYIVAQHLSPKHQSMLVQLIGRETNMQVKEVVNGEIPEANTMYVTPPNNDVFVNDGALWLREPISEISPKPSVDLLFTSMAEQIGDHAIGVILSGTGSDGSHGVRALRAAGGITIAQTTETAKYDGMPNAAIETRCVDLILKPDEIISEIASIIRSPKHFKLLQEEETSRSSIDELLYLLKEHTGVDFKDYKPGTLYRRINRRITACGTNDLDGYLDHVQANKDELDLLFKDITITVTSFFRDTLAFDEFNKKFSKILADKKGDEPIRIWVPGCATGEEAYSLAILIAEYFGGLPNLAQQNNIQIFATDIDADALARARKGLYPAATLENIDANLREKYFRHRDMSFEVLKPLRDMIVFSRHNVLEDPPFLRLDIITCRNLLIYFNSKLQHHVLNLFHYSLLPSGLLFLGKSESLGSSASLFQAVDSKNKLYKRKLLPSKDSKTTIRNSFGMVKKVEAQTALNPTNKALHDLPDSIVEAFAPDSLLIDENMDVVRIYGDIHAFMQLAPGGVSTNLMSMARKEFRQELRALVFKVLRENASSTILPKKLDIQGKMHEVNIVIRPLSFKHSSEKLLIISFEKVKPLTTQSNEKVDKNIKDPILVELEQELVATREHLQTVVEELETSNEELLTVNEELNIKSAELGTTNEELSNIKESIDYPLIVVDKELKIKRFNMSAHKLFMLEDTSDGEILTSIATLIDIPDIRQNCLQVIKTGKPYTRQLDDKDHCYLERILPYKDDNYKVMGAVLTYTDNTAERKAQIDLEESQQRYNLAIEGTNSGIWDWSIKEDNLLLSPVLCDILGLKFPHVNMSFSDLQKRIHSDDREDVQTILDAHLQRGFNFNVECRMQHESGGYIWVNVSGKAVWNDKHKPTRMAGSINNITDRRLAIEQLTESNESLNRFAYVCSHDLKEPVRMIENFLDLYLKKYGMNLDEEAKLYLDQTTKSSKRIQDMIHDILLYSQLENRSTQYGNVKCKEEIKKALENLALTINETKAIISYDDMPVIRGDQMQIFQVFQNLISNALKFCKGKTPQIIITAKDRDDHWEFSVKDNGIGMEQEHVNKIFDVFQRLNLREEYPGTGIGLSICQRAVIKHGGKIWAKSKPENGSTFFFTISKNISKKGENNVYSFKKIS